MSGVIEGNKEVGEGCAGEDVVVIIKKDETVGINNNNNIIAIPSIYTIDDIKQITSLPSFIKALIENTIIAFEPKQFEQYVAAPIQTLTPNKEGLEQTCVKSGYFIDNPYYTMKVASGGGKWINSGCMQIYSQSTGKLEALLLDEGILTELRTAAIGTVLIKLIFFNDNNNNNNHIVNTNNNNTIIKIGMIGTGVQARYQLRMIQNVLPKSDCKYELYLWGRSPEKVLQLKQELLLEDNNTFWDVIDIITTSPDDVFIQNCSIIITTTSSTEPILGKTFINNTQQLNYGPILIICIGSDTIGKQEVDVQFLLNIATILIADLPTQSIQRGEFQSLVVHYNDNNIIDNKILSLSQIIHSPLTISSSDVIVFDSSGLPMQDTIIATMVYDALKSSIID